MKEKEILKKLPCYKYTLTEEFKEIAKEDMELYLFLRGGFAAK